MGWNFQRLGDFDENFNRGGALAALNAANVIVVNVCLLREGFLAQSSLLAELENGFADNFALRFLEHCRLKKQKRRKAATHAACIIDF